MHSYALLTREELIRTVSFNLRTQVIVYVITYIYFFKYYCIQVESPDTPSKSVLKLAIAFSYCLLSLLITAFVMVLVHDRVPGKND